MVYNIRVYCIERLEGVNMLIKRLKIKGLRGFSKGTNINFAIPDNENIGSGLTVLVGPNNSGKSTIIEAIHMLTNRTDIVPITSRNTKNDGKIEIEVEDIIGNILTLKSTDNKGAFIERMYNNQTIEVGQNNMNTFILSSKRAFSSTFHNNYYQTRENYRGNISDNDYRSENNINNNFGGRLLTIYKNREKFDKCLEKVLSPLPEWTIEASSDSNLYLEFSFNGIKHSSKGAGDGYINIFNIVDALYDSTENNVILIDEPEISLHPDLQRKLFSLLVEYSKNKQIIISTHSPYFVDWKLFSEKSKIIRFKKTENDIETFELTDETREGIKKLIDDKYNPHILSLNANEIFFLKDDVILTEGQEDVLCYKEIFKKYSYNSKESFFGWGAGGAPKIEFVLNILKDLGYEKVFTILDNDQKEKILGLRKKYPKYEFYSIVTDDIRDKTRNNKIDQIIDMVNKLNCDENEKEYITRFINSHYKNKKGLVIDMSTYEINKEYEEDIINLLENIKKYFNSEVIKEYTKETEISIKKIEDRLVANQLLEEWLKNNKLSDYIPKRYKRFKFSGGGGGELSFKKIKVQKYYVMLEESHAISQNYSITICYHIIINTRKNKVRLKKRQIISNTLPTSKISKFIEKIIN